MKKLLCIVLAIAMLTGVLILPVSAVSQNTSDKYAEQFEQYLTNIGHTPYYKGEKLYFYYELYEYYSDTNTSDTPDWVLAESGVNTASPAGCNGIFGKYNLVLYNIYCPYSLLYHIYIPSQNKFYTLSDAWTERIEGLENAFTEYLVPNELAELIEDADGDGKITEFDASKYDGYFTYYNSFEECKVNINGEWFYYYGDGCYGTVKDGGVSDCIRQDHNHEFMFKDKFIDKFISEYETEIAKYMAYDEQYYHYDENGEIDWALIYADKHITEPWNYHIVYEDRILTYGSKHPFSFGYGIYDAKTGEFHDIITDKGRRYEFDLSAYDGLEEVFDSLKIGFPIGDANHDHELSIMDATQIQLVLAKLATFEDEDRVEYYHGYKDWSELGYPKYISDINCDGERNILDATAIQMKLAKLA